MLIRKQTSNMRGIDVSVWQGRIDFKLVKKSGLSFVILRAGYGGDPSQEDPCFEENYAKALASGLHLGAYWYSYATSPKEARQEAVACKEVLAGKRFDFPVHFDLEEPAQLKRGGSFCDSLIHALCKEMEAGGYFAGFYTSLYVAGNLLYEAVRTRYAFWIAQCTYKGQYGLWQYSSKGMAPGINGPVDLDLSFVNHPEIIRKGGYNGYGQVGPLSTLRREQPPLPYSKVKMP